jgi:hypothetical protein
LSSVRETVSIFIRIICVAGTSYLHWLYWKGYVCFHTKLMIGNMSHSLMVNVHSLIQFINHWRLHIKPYERNYRLSYFSIYPTFI